MQRTLVPTTPDRSPEGIAARKADLKRRLLDRADEYEAKGRYNQADFWRDLAERP